MVYTLLEQSPPPWVLLPSGLIPVLEEYSCLLLESTAYWFLCFWSLTFISFILIVCNTAGMCFLTFYIITRIKVFLLCCVTFSRTELSLNLERSKSPSAVVLVIQTLQTGVSCQAAWNILRVNGMIWASEALKNEKAAQKLSCFIAVTHLKALFVCSPHPTATQREKLWSWGQVSEIWIAL